MAAKRPRLAITLSPEAQVFIREVSQLTNQSQASIASELIDASLPAMQAGIEAIRLAASGADREAQRMLANISAEHVGMLMQAQLDLDAAIDRRTVKGKRRPRDAGPTN